MRPNLFYVVFQNGEILSIVSGSRQAKMLSPSFKSFNTLVEAEEFAAWWEYDHPRWETTTRINRTKERSA